MGAIDQAYTVDYSNDGIPDWIFKVSSNEGVGIMSVLGTLEAPLQPWLVNEPEVLVPLTYSGVRTLPFMDADDDFDLDLKFISGLSQFNATEVVHMENDGSGAFTEIEVPGFTTARANSFGTWGDLNQDGLNDFATGRADCCVEEGMMLHYANEDGSFDAFNNALDYDYNPYIGGGAILDLDLDGREDLIWTRTATTNQTRIFAHRQLEAFIESQVTQ